MNSHDPLKQTLLDLHAILGPTVPLILGGGYLLMKLLAFRDRANDAGKDLARHHALDIYRIIGLITQDEDQTVRDMAAKHREHPKVIEARAVVAEYFSRSDSLGILRMREHPLAAGRVAIDPFIAEIVAILPPPA